MKLWPDSVLSNKLFKLGFLKSCHKMSNEPHHVLQISIIMSRFYFLQNLQLFMLSLLFKLVCELKRSWIYNKSNVMTTIIRTHIIIMMKTLSEILQLCIGVSLVLASSSIEKKHIQYTCYFTQGFVFEQQHNLIY